MPESVTQLEGHYKKKVQKDQNTKVIVWTGYAYTHEHVCW